MILILLKVSTRSMNTASERALGIAAGTYTAGLPTQHFIPASVQRTFKVKVYQLYVVRDAVDGSLHASFFA